MTVISNHEQDLSNLGGARILVLFPHMVIPGGALSYSLQLADQLLKHGATVATLTLRADRAAFAFPESMEVIALDGPLTSSLGFWLLYPLWQARINRRVAEWRPDVLVTHVFPANWWGWLYKRGHPQTRLAWICHEPSAFIHSRAWIMALRPRWKGFLARALRPVMSMIDIRLARHSDRVVANSRFTAAELERIYGLTPDGIACPGIDFGAFSVAQGQKEPSFITVGRLTKFKRVDFLLRVFREVLKVRPGLTYHIVGTGDEETALRDLARQLEVSSRVFFHGTVAAGEIVELYRCATLFLHGSIDEPFGMAPLEAIACGTPVVAHRSGGPMEFVTTECGRLVDSLDVAAWAKEIVAYLDDLASTPGAPHRVRACARCFDWPLSLRPAVGIIAGLCARRGSVARPAVDNSLT